MQVRRDQVDKRGEQTAKGPDQRGNRESQRPVAPATVYQATVIAAATDGLSVRVRAESQLFPTR